MQRAPVKKLLLLALAAVVLGCSSPANEAPIGTEEQTKPIVESQGGPVLAHPALVTITFAGDSNAGEIEAWGDWVVGSAWLKTVGADYGVGAGSHLAKVRLESSAPTKPTSSGLGALVGSLVADGTLPAPTADVLYAFYFPESTTLTNGAEVFCTDFSAYHDETTVLGTPVAFAAVGHCASNTVGLTEWEHVQRAASHELMEAAADPLPNSNPGYNLGNRVPSAPTANFALELAAKQGEVGDLCESMRVVEEDKFVAQRIWSNTAAEAGGDPCIPAQTRPFFNVAAPMSWYSIAPGASVVIPLAAHSDEPVENWIVGSSFGYNIGGFTLHTESATTTTTSDDKTRATTNDGKSLTLTVTAPADATPGKSLAGIEIRSRTATSEMDPDETREDSYHYTAVGVYVGAWP